MGKLGWTRERRALELAQANKRYLGVLNMLRKYFSELETSDVFAD